jgi:hypothetical protein
VVIFFSGWRRLAAHYSYIPELQRDYEIRATDAEKSADSIRDLLNGGKDPQCKTNPLQNNRHSTPFCLRYDTVICRSDRNKAAAAISEQTIFGITAISRLTPTLQ